MVTERSGSGSESSQKLQGALVPSAAAMTPLAEFALEATVPLLLITGILLVFPRLGRSWLLLLAGLGGLVAAVGFGRVLTTVVYDIAGIPDYALPVWAVLYLVVQLVLFFTFVFFGLHLGAPGRFVRGFSTESTGGAFLDAMYLSLTNYISVSPDPTISAPHLAARYLTVAQGLLSLFVNVVIITKFVNTF
jgi:hypothetical protein